MHCVQTHLIIGNCDKDQQRSKAGWLTVSVHVFGAEIKTSLNIVPSPVRVEFALFV